MTPKPDSAYDYKKWFLYLLLFVISLAFVIGGYFTEKRVERAASHQTAGEGHEEDGESIMALTSHVITEIGIAGIVGIILALTFERLSAEEFRKLAKEERDEVKTNVFYNVYGRDIPAEIREIIDRQILKANFVRENVRVDFILEPIESPFDCQYVRLTTRMSYDIRNLTLDDQIFIIRSSIDQAPVSELNAEVKFTSVQFAGDPRLSFSYNEQQLQGMKSDPNPAIMSDDNKYEKWIEKEVVIPQGLPPRLTISSQMVKHMEGGNVYFIVSNHTCDLEMRVTVQRLNLEVIGDAFADNILKPTSQHEPSKNIYSWKLERPLLAYQGIFILWVSKRDAGSPPSQPVVEPPPVRELRS